MTTILSTGDKLYTDRRSTLSGNVFKKLLNGSGRDKVHVDFYRKIYLLPSASKLAITTDREFLGIKEEDPYPTAKAIVMAGDAEVSRIIYDAIKAHAKADVAISAVIRMVSQCRLDVLAPLTACIISNDGRTFSMSANRDSSQKSVQVGLTIDKTGTIKMQGSGSKYYHPEMNYTPEQAKDLFLACCYLDSSSSVNYDVYDLASDTLVTVTPTQDEIKESLGKVGLGGMWMGPKAILDHLEKK